MEEIMEKREMNHPTMSKSNLHSKYVMLWDWKVWWEWKGVLYYELLLENKQIIPSSPPDKPTESST